MPIEFRCTQCDKLLRTKDDTAGKQAKCPQCGTVLRIPAPAPVAATSDRLPPSLPPQSARPVVPQQTVVPQQVVAPQQAVVRGMEAPSANPYLAPTTRVSSRAQPMGEIGYGKLDFGDAFSRTWEVFKNNLGLCIVLGVLPLLLLGCGFGLVFLLSVVVMFIAPSPIVFVAMILFGVLGLATFFVWLHVGVLHTFLKIARGEQAGLGDVFAGGPWLTVFLAGLLFTLAVTLGYIALIVPGVFLALMLWPFPFLIIERNLGAVESLKSASAITRGNKLTVLGVFIVFSVINGLVGSLTLGLGSLVTFPFFMLMQAVMYLIMTGQLVGAGGNAGASMGAV